MDDFKHFVSGYYETFLDVLRRVEADQLRGILDVLLDVADRGATVYVAGNGGSASIADHTACDISKGTHADGHGPIRTVSLASNAAMITAIANDVSYDQIYRKQLEFYLREGDVVLLVSASGNSPNVVEACRYARKQCAPTIAFVGFEGGELKRIADHVVHVEVDNYGMAEDTHQSIMHVLSQYIAHMRSEA